jgi:hypothetical protein
MPVSGRFVRTQCTLFGRSARGRRHVIRRLLDLSPSAGDIRRHQHLLSGASQDTLTADPLDANGAQERQCESSG